jgi:general secretion pathway protein K
MMRHRANAASSQHGFIIVAVLWILIALSSLAMIFSMYLSASAHALAVGDAALKAEALVSAGVELTAYQLTLTGDDTRPPRGTFRFRMNDADVAVTFTSESARIDLNLAPKELLAGLFAALGAGKGTAMEDAERIVGWRTRPVPNAVNDEAALYAAAGLRYLPRQALFVHADELALVVGLPPALVERALPYVTVFNGSSDVDPAIAAPEVVAALPKKDKDKSADIFGDRPAPPSNPPAGDGATTRPGVQTAPKSTCYRIDATISFSNGRRTSSEVVIAIGDKSEPYRVLSWQDDVEPRRPPVRPRRSS